MIAEGRVPRNPGRRSGHHLHHRRGDGGAHPHGECSLRSARGRCRSAGRAPDDHAPRLAGGGTRTLRLPGGPVRSSREVQRAATLGPNVV